MKARNDRPRVCAVIFLHMIGTDVLVLYFLHRPSLHLLVYPTFRSACSVQGASLKSIRYVSARPVEDHN